MNIYATITGDVRTFLASTGEMGQLVYAFDWAATPLGPLSEWPQSLKTAVGMVLLSPVPTVLLLGDDGIMIYNDAYARLAGNRHPNLLGRKVREGWSEVAAFADNVMNVVLGGAALAYRDHPLPLHKDNVPQPAWMNLYFSPVLDDNGKPAGVMGIVVETTKRMLATAALRQSDLRKALLLSLVQAQRETHDATAMMQVAAERLARHLQANRVGFRELTGDGVLSLAPCWTDGALEPPSSLPACMTGPRYLEMARMGHTFSGTSLDETLAAMGDAVPGVQSFIDAPIMRNGALCASLHVEHATARAWTEADISLVRSVADQTWDAVERARAEAALRHSEEQLRLATDAAEVGLWDFSPATGVLFCPPSVKRTFGLSADAPVTVADFKAALHPDEREAVLAAFAAAIDPARRALYDVEYRVLGKEDGITRWVAAKGRGVFDSDGACVRAIGTAIDISARKAVEAQLNDLKDSLERQVEQRTADRDRIWRHSRDLLVIFGADGIFRAVNPAWTTVLGHATSDVVGRGFLDFVWPEDAEATQRALDAMATGDDLPDFENRYQRNDGAFRWISWHISVEGDLVFATGRDVTKAKEQDAALKAAEAALRQSQKMEAVGQLTGGLAHDFNNLLNVISGSLEIIQMRLERGWTASLDRYIGTAVGATERAAALTHRLLAFSRRQPLDPMLTDVNRLVSELDDLVRRSVGPGVAIRIVGADGLWPTLVDPNQLENALLNLCINARDAMPDGGRLTIETANRVLDEQAVKALEMPAGQYVTLSVTDTGTGMTPEVVAKAFDPFFTTKPPGEGTGLGLSMIYGFARQSGGQLRIYTEPGSGTTMCLYLPRHDAPPEAGPHGGGHARAGQARNGETVLLIDDEPAIRMLVSDTLKEAGYAVLEAPDGQSGLNLLRSAGKIDLLVTDVGLPGGFGGRQVADAARSLQPGLKVIFITGYAENAVIDSVRHEAGMRVITKPFAIDDLVRKIAELLNA